MVAKNNISEALRVCVIGCGAVVEELHGPALQRLVERGEAKVTALVDTGASRLERFQRIFPQAGGFAKAEAAFTGGNVDVTLVASPPSLHRQHSELAMRAGSHVLCEKPLTTTAADAAFLAGVARETKRVLAVGLTRRFFPSLATAAAIVARGELGDRLQFTCREGDLCGWPLTSDALFRRSLAGGGTLADKGVHVLDALLWVLGRMEVTAVEDDALDDGVEGNIRLTLKNERVQGTLQLSWDQALNNGLWIRGDRGELRFQPDKFPFVELRAGNGGWGRRPCEATWPAECGPAQPVRQQPKNYDECIGLQWIAMLRAIRHGEAMPVDAGAAEFVIAQIDQAYRLARPLAQPWLAGEESTAATARHWKGALQA
jgi:predicted dehydrogenase